MSGNTTNHACPGRSCACRHSMSLGYPKLSGRLPEPLCRVGCDSQSRCASLSSSLSRSGRPTWCPGVFAQRPTLRRRCVAQREQATCSRRRARSRTVRRPRNTHIFIGVDSSVLLSGFGNTAPFWKNRALKNDCAPVRTHTPSGQSHLCHAISRGRCYYGGQPAL